MKRPPKRIRPREPEPDGAGSGGDDGVTPGSEAGGGDVAADADADVAQVANLSVAEVLELRRLRRKQRGVDADELARGDPELRRLRDQEEATPKDPWKLVTGGLVNLNEIRNKKLHFGDDPAAKASGGFATASNVMDTDKKMCANEFIDREILKRRSAALQASHEVSSQDGAEGAAESRAPIDTSELYQIPDNLQTASKPVQEGNVTLSTAMLTAIPEVDLGLTTKLKNIEATEKAKQDFIHKKKKPSSQSEVSIDKLPGQSLTASARWNNQIHKFNRDTNNKPRPAEGHEPERRDGRKFDKKTMATAIVSRQFVEMPRARIEGLLASFPKLIGSNDQHTFVETDSVRYVYQPLEELYMVLVTNKQSNILQDIDTLHLFARVVSEYCRSIDEREITRNNFELINVFDEVVSMGYRESINLSQIRTITEMDSHDERIQAEIEKNKEKEAKDELNRKARMMEMQKREMAKKGMSSMSGFGGSGGNFAASSNPYTVGAKSTYSSDTHSSSPSESFSSFSTDRPSVRPSAAKGMQLGKKAKTEALVEAIKSDEGIRDLPVQSDSLPIAISNLPQEKIVVRVNRDGGLEAMEVKGKLELKTTDAGKAHLRVALKTDESSGTQFTIHPNIDKKLFPPTLALRDPSRPFPVGQVVGILKWRFQTKDESLMPLSINCWPSPSGNGTCDVNIEYELQVQKLELRNVVIVIPYSASGDPIIHSAEGHPYQVDRHKKLITWSIPIIDQQNSSGVLEFTVNNEDVGSFFPIRVNFASTKPYCDVEISDVTTTDGVPALYSQEALLTTEEYDAAVIPQGAPDGQHPTTSLPAGSAGPLPSAGLNPSAFLSSGMPQQAFLPSNPPAMLHAQFPVVPQILYGTYGWPHMGAVHPAYGLSTPPSTLLAGTPIPSAGFAASAPAPGAVPDTAASAPSLIPGEDAAAVARRQWWEERERLRILDERRRADDEFLRERELAERLQLQRAEARRERERSEAERRAARARAAITIQRHFRGFRVRRRFLSWAVNEYALERAPDVYFAELLLHEVLCEEVIPDVLVEFLEGLYHPITFTAKFQQIRAALHVRGEVVSEILHEVCAEAWEEAYKSAYFRTSRFEKELQQLEIVVAESVADELDTICRQAISEFAEKLLLDYRAADVFNGLVDELIADTEVIQSAAAELELTSALNVLLNEEIVAEIKRAAYAAGKELGVRVYRTRRGPSGTSEGAQPSPRSKTVDRIMDELLDRVLLDTLVTRVLRTGGDAMLEWDTADRVVDSLVLESLVGQLSSLAGVQFL
ncbi:Coatomer subunit delta [Cladochytrium tenue]|nr:Coatomer subunit delta [Cladochytrium tenue]